MAWQEAIQEERETPPPVLQTKEDCVLNGRAWERDGGAEELEVRDTLYADDTGEFFRLRAAHAAAAALCRTCHGWSSSWPGLASSCT
jgi:hypothetical protein